MHHWHFRGDVLTGFGTSARLLSTGSRGHPRAAGPLRAPPSPCGAPRWRLPARTGRVGQALASAQQLRRAWARASVCVRTRTCTHDDCVWRVPACVCLRVCLHGTRPCASVSGRGRPVCNSARVPADCGRRDCRLIRSTRATCVRRSASPSQPPPKHLRLRLCLETPTHATFRVRIQRRTAMGNIAQRNISPAVAEREREFAELVHRRRIADATPQSWQCHSRGHLSAAT
jgi:hypothetical protein